MQVVAGLMDVLKPITTLGGGKPLNEGIAEFYDESTSLWEDMWGDHLHHGYYPPGELDKSNRQAQIDMIEESLKWAGVDSVSRMVDVGCGIGGSSRYIVKKYGGKANGVTLSSFQAQRANEISQEEGVDASFQVGDALNMPYEDNTFDLCWSMESGEHMPDKRKFVTELARVAAPGGRILIVTWCHRVLTPENPVLSPEEQALLDRICEAYYLPKWCSIADYVSISEELGLQEVCTADWSEFVAPFWGKVIQTALTGKGILGLFTAGWGTIKGALVMPLMAQGFRMGLIKFNLITAVKPK